MKHWTKFNHITFLIALVLAALNLYFQKMKYDIQETKKSR